MSVFGISTTGSLARSVSTVFSIICRVLARGDGLKSIVEAQQGRDTRDPLSLQHALEILVPVLHPVNLDGFAAEFIVLRRLGGLAAWSARRRPYR